MLFLPGTVIHELAHVLSAGVLLVHVGEVEFMPQQTPEGIKLGSAQIGQRHFFGVAVTVGMSVAVTVG